MSHRRTGSRPLSAALALSLTGGTLAGLGIVAAAPAGAITMLPCVQPTQTYGSGASGTYTVPAGASTVDVVASGTAGAPGIGSAGGAGATVSTTLDVTPGQVLAIAVAGSPNDTVGGLSGGSLSGGSVRRYQSSARWGGGGGGATFVSSSGQVLVAAGGGGGGGYADPWDFPGYYAPGGSAGPVSLTSTTGVFSGGDGATDGYGTPATGGSTTVGHGGGTPGGVGGPGYDGNGQVGGDSGDNSGSGAGGGGFKGGGGATYYSLPGSGGAGSSYAASPYTIIANNDAGSLTISAAVDPAFQSASSATFIENTGGSFQVCAPGGPGTTVSYTGTLPAGVTFVDNLDGTATLAGTATQAGEFPLTITSTSSSGTEQQPFVLSVHDVTAKTLEVTTTPSIIAAGGSVDVTVTAFDAQHDVASNDNDPLDLSSTDVHSTLPSVSLTNGTVTFSASLATAGTQTITADDVTSEGNISGTSNDVAVTPAAVASYSVVLGTSANAGQTVSAAIKALDSYGNVVTSDNEDLLVSSSDSRATVAPHATLAAGQVTIPVSFATVGLQTVSATDADTGTFTGTSDPVNISAGPTSKLTMTALPLVVAGSNNVVFVQPKDGYGNSTHPSDVIHFSSTDPNAVLPADSAWDSIFFGISNVTFKTAGSQTLTVSDVTHPDVEAASQTVTVTAGVAQTMATQGGDQQAARASHVFDSVLSTLVTDANGNPVSGQAVVFSVPSGSTSSFGGQPSSTAVSNSNGIATAGPLTAGPTPGNLVITASAGSVPIAPPCIIIITCIVPPLPAGPSVGSVAFTETITASDATAAAVAQTSTGVGASLQTVTVTVPAGGSITLLDASNQPVTQLVTADGTYVLNPSTGVITFVAAAGFSGTAAAVTYQVTDAYNLQATATYTPVVTAPATIAPPVAPPVVPPVSPPTVHPLGTASVRTAAHSALTGSTIPATCTVSLSSIKTCRTTITAHVSGRQVVLGTSTMVKAEAGSKSVKTVIRLNALGRGLAAQVGGVKVAVWAAVVKSDGRTLLAKSAATIVDWHVLVADPVLFPSNGTALTAKAKHDLRALKGKLGAVKAVRCIGYTDAVGDSALNAALGQARAKSVCAALAGRGFKVVVVTRGDAHPMGDNATDAGRALNRRVEITLTY